ncbi:MAG: hypothetical protein MI702_12385, partial [Chlorobiales bacterium]|nr:hypothetical protein [Chlorobiales bacterium]
MDDLRNICCLYAQSTDYETGKVTIATESLVAVAKLFKNLLLLVLAVPVFALLKHAEAAPAG